MTGNVRSPGTRRGVLGSPALRSLTVPVALLLGLGLLVWAAGAGPVRVLSPSPREVAGPTTSTPTVTQVAEPSPDPVADAERRGQPRFDLSWIGDVLTGALLLGVAVLVWLALRWLWARRPSRRELVPDQDFELLPDAAVADALRRDAPARLAAIEQGTPRNGIVLCWVRLQDAVTAAGVPPHPAETSAELAVRVLRGLDLDPRTVGRLAELYREARFSEHELVERHRQEARAALARLHAELGVADPERTSS